MVTSSVWSRFDWGLRWGFLRQCSGDMSCRRTNTVGDKTFKLRTTSRWGYGLPKCDLVFRCAMKTAIPRSFCEPATESGHSTSRAMGNSRKVDENLDVNREGKFSGCTSSSSAQQFIAIFVYLYPSSSLLLHCHPITPSRHHAITPSLYLPCMCFSFSAASIS